MKEIMYKLTFHSRILLKIHVYTDYKGTWEDFLGVMEMFNFNLLLGGSCEIVQVRQNTKNGTPKRVDSIYVNYTSINLKKNIHIYFKLIFNSYYFCPLKWTYFLFQAKANLFPLKRYLFWILSWKLRMNCLLSYL